MMSKWVLSIHRVLGTILSLLFLMWFASGFVMLFYSFPSITSAERLRGLPSLPPYDSIEGTRLDSLLARVDSGAIHYLRLTASPRGAGYDLRVTRGDSTIFVTTQPMLERGYTAALLYAQRLSKAPIARVDTLYDVDTWIPYRRKSAPFPIYRFYYDDEEGSELSVASATSEGVQLTTRETRLWAYLGAIPHWIYFASLRQHRDLWSTTIIIISALGTLMCISGIWVGLRSLWLTRRSRRGLHSPYKKWDYRWHHIVGFVFGLSVTVFIFSGLMSVQEVPQALVPTSGQVREQLGTQSIGGDAKLWSSQIRRLITTYGKEGVKSIEWRALGRHTYLILSTEQRAYHLDATSQDLRPLSLSRADMERFAKEVLQVSCRIDSLTEYDNYYIDRRGDLPLPVYRLTLDDADTSTLYVDAKTANYTYYDKATRLRRLLYQGLHSLVFAPLIKYPLVWWTLVGLSLVGGLLLSVTGLSLSWRYLRRLVSRWV